MKNITKLFGALLLVKSLFCVAPEAAPTIYRANKHIDFSDKKPIMVFDIHNVLMQKQWMGGLRNFFDTAKTATKKALLVPKFGIAACDPRVLYGIGSTFYNSGKGKHKVTESYFNIVNYYGHKAVFGALVSFANNIFVPMPGIQKTLEKLKGAGCELELLSNIGPQTFADLNEKHTEFFRRFNNPVINLINSEVRDDAYDTFKPQPAAYNTALGKLRDRNPGKDIEASECVFVDDKLKNVKAAQAAGWNAIHFQSVEQLENDLRKMGVLNETE